MARRQLLSNEAWSARLAPAVDDREVIRHYTLSEDDFDGIARRGHDVSPELIRHVAPLGWQHIALTGDYSWNLAAPLAPDALRPLRNESSILAA